MKPNGGSSETMATDDVAFGPQLINALLAANQGGLNLDWIEKEWLAIYPMDDPRWQNFRAAVAEYYDR